MGATNAQSSSSTQYHMCTLSNLQTMATTSNQPAISILMNKLEDVRGTTLPPALQNYISDAETEYEVMCKRLGGDVKQIKAIEEMVFALKNNQILSAKSHAHGAQRAMLLYQKTLQRKVDEVNSILY